MNKVFGILLVGLSCLISLSAFAFDKSCALNFSGYSSPSIAGCVMRMTRSSGVSFTRNGQKTSLDGCFKNTGLSPDLIEAMKSELQKDELRGEILNLNLKVYENGYSGEFKSNVSWTQPISFPLIKRDWGGTAKAYLDNGVEISITLKTGVQLILRGDFGTIRYSGTCKKYAAKKNKTLESSISSPIKIDKAKSTCTELGFTAGTEKHGECVLKLMDY